MCRSSLFNKNLIPLSLLLIAILTGYAEAQKSFRLNDASKMVDVELNVGNCGDDTAVGRCGPLKVSFFRKAGRRAFQVVTLPETNMWDRIPRANVTRRYDDQSIINFADFDFDGMDDVAICDGTDGGYGMPSYKVYLYSKPLKRFILSRPFTRMNSGGLGMFETDGKKKMHFVYTKSGCCWHQTQGFDVYQGRPRKIYELTIDATNLNASYSAKITTRKLIQGRWRTWVKHEK